MKYIVFVIRPKPNFHFLYLLIEYMYPLFINLYKFAERRERKQKGPRFITGQRKTWQVAIAPRRDDIYCSNQQVEICNIPVPWILYVRNSSLGFKRITFYKYIYFIDPT